MNIALGEAGLYLGLIGAVVGVITLVVGLVKGRDNLLRVGRSYTWLILGGAVVATIAIQIALITRDYSLTYVANNDSNATPLLYRITAMWSDLDGSILLWALVLAGFIAAVTIHFRKRLGDPLVGWALAVSYLVAAFFFGLMITVSNPFSRVHGALPTNGPGPDPLLQNNVLVLFHPPLLYLGLVGFTVPFSFAVASLITGRVGEGWLLETRRWTLFSWGFLTGGVILGAWWSYQVLGWGGFWAWDPVENSAFLPWLTATAFLHSVMVQERRGMLRVWNLSLILATFSLTILGTFLTRSGLLESVHSFAGGPVGTPLLVFFGLIVVSSIALIAWRGDRLRSPGSIDSPISREGAFLANNLLFGAFAAVVLIGTVFPLIAQDVNGSSLTIGAPYFNTLSMPIVVCLLFLMAVAPVLPWRKASGELLRKRLFWPAAAGVATLVLTVAFGVRGLNALLAYGLGAFAAGSALRQLAIAIRRQGARGFVGRVNGGMIVHLGVIMIAVAFAASHAYEHQSAFTMKVGQTQTFDGHSLTYLGTRTVSSPIDTALQAKVRVDGGRVLYPAISNYSTEAVGTPAVESKPLGDVYLTLDEAPVSTGGAAVIGVIIVPLVSWVWVGGGVMLVGTALAAFPGRRRRRPTDPVSSVPPDEDAFENPVDVARIDAMLDEIEAGVGQQ
jgi:cytochrome c-type biogenesis protein CcmF